VTQLGEFCTKLPKAYEAAVALLVGLRDLAERADARTEFDRRVATLRREHAQKRGLIDRLERAREKGGAHAWRAGVTPLVVLALLLAEGLNSDDRACSSP
jgi:hypothetical protein